eukprot:TRINITY_DN10894_c0_g1_i1.p1 TRINITY_DN10894_c0_g1~~TRINITY_DN10894_c0_g1_i1.p1  ORF type:complete len:243 (-),score=45.66 TRINITY_DN10894_c0_g1_i1:185-913(-)
MTTDRFAALSQSTERFLSETSTIYCPHGGGFANQLTDAGRVIKSVVDATEGLDAAYETETNDVERRSLHKLLLTLTNIAISPDTSTAVGRAYAFHTLALLENSLPANVIAPYLLYVMLRLHQKPEYTQEQFESMMGCVMFSGNSLSKLSYEITDYLKEITLDSLSSTSSESPYLPQEVASVRIDLTDDKIVSHLASAEVTTLDELLQLNKDCFPTEIASSPAGVRLLQFVSDFSFLKNSPAF